MHLVNAPATLITTDGLAALELAVDTGIAATCAEAVGVMDKTTGHHRRIHEPAQTQFGVFIASFQALRHRVADMKMQLELARSMSYYASLKLSAPAEERRAAMARAKVQLGQSMRFVGQQAVQLHGGIGVTDEYIVSHYFKEAHQLEVAFGDTLHHLGEVSARMQRYGGRVCLSAASSHLFAHEDATARGLYAHGHFASIGNAPNPPRPFFCANPEAIAQHAPARRPYGILDNHCLPANPQAPQTRQRLHWSVRDPP